MSYEHHDEYEGFREFYSDYTRSRGWRAKRAKVFERANNTCEGCLEKPARIAHHLTYQHLGHELLYELVALCHECHERAHLPRQRAYDPWRRRWTGVRSGNGNNNCVGSKIHRFC